MGEDTAIRLANIVAASDSENITIQIAGELIPTDVLLQKERRCVNDKLIQLYSKEIQEILSKSPLRVWRNPEDSSEIRVIDGLHRLFSVERYNSLMIEASRIEEIVADIPCIVETYSRDEFLERRQQQTLAHGQIAGFRGIDWLIDAYEEENFGLREDQKVSLSQILGLYRSTAQDKGKNFLSMYNISREHLDSMKKFVAEWIGEYGLKGLAAVDIFEAIMLLGRENIDILGLEDMKRDHVKTVYSMLGSLKEGERRQYANHILRITAGLDASRGKIMNLAKVVQSNIKGDYRERILEAKDYDEAEKVYGKWKELEEQEQVEAYRKRNLADTAPQVRVSKEELLLKKHYPKQQDPYDTGDTDYSGAGSGFGKGSEEESDIEDTIFGMVDEDDMDIILAEDEDEINYDPDVEAVKNLGKYLGNEKEDETIEVETGSDDTIESRLDEPPRPRLLRPILLKPQGRDQYIPPPPKNKPKRITVNRQHENVVRRGEVIPDLSFVEGNFGDIIYSYGRSGTGALLLQAGSAFVINNGPVNSFYRIKAPHLMIITEDVATNEKPRVIAGADNTGTILYSRIAEADNISIGINMENLPFVLGGMYNSLRNESAIEAQASKSTINHMMARYSPEKRLAMMFQSQTYRFDKRSNYFAAVPETISLMLAGSVEEYQSFFQKLGDTVVLLDDSGLIEVTDPTSYEIILDNIINS